jgi:hypothetical protein
MGIQDAIASACVVCAAAFLFHKLIYQPFRSSKADKGCGSGCGKCSEGNSDTIKLGTREALVRIGDLKQNKPRAK